MGNKKKIRYSKIIVLLVILLNVAFTAAVICVYLKIMTEPTTLIISWFAFTTGELWALALLRTKELEKEGGKHEDQLESTEGR